MKTEFNPNLRTPKEDFSKEELNKLNSKNAFEGNLHQEFRNDQPDLSWESEQIAKSSGIYLEFDRATKGDAKDWIYMMRIAIPGGGPLSAEQWRVLDELSERFTRDPQGKTSLRITTRQNIQFHWVRKAGVLEIVKALAAQKMKSLNGCGDNARNITACPLSRYSDLFDANSWARDIAQYFQLPVEPYIRVFELDPDEIGKPRESFAYGSQLLNRKFKIGFSTAHRDPRTGRIIPDNCTEFLTNDVGISPVFSDGLLKRFQIYIGGGQGQRSGKPTAAMLAKPFTQIEPQLLLALLDAIVSVHQEWGDRQNRHWARLKYVVLKMGLEWFAERVHERLGHPLDPPDPLHDYGVHKHHHGWTTLPQTGQLAFGMFIENGRVRDGSPNGNIKKTMRFLVDKYQPEIVLSPNQNVLLCNIPPDRKQEFELDLNRLEYGRRAGTPFSILRLNSSACVGLDTCRLAYTDSERFEPLLIDELEAMGWANLATSIGVTGCERQCDRPSTKAVGLVGSGLNKYQLRLMGTEDGRHQGGPLFSQDRRSVLLRFIPREKVAPLLDVLFRFYMDKRQENETLGYFNRRIGMQSIIDHLATDPVTADLMKHTTPSDDYLIV